MGYSSTQIQSQDFYKVNFLEVLELVKGRRVFVKNGFAYVTIQDFGSVLLHVFRSHLSKSLSVILNIYEILLSQYRKNIKYNLNEYFTRL